MMEVATEWDVLLFFPSLLKADRTHVVTHFTSLSLSHSAPAYGCSSAAGTEMDESVCHHIVLHKGKEISVLVELLRFHHNWSEMEHLSVLQSHLMRGWKTIIDFHILIKARYQRVFCAVWKEVLLNWGSTRICWIVCTVQKKTKKTTAWSSFKYPHLYELTCLVGVKHVLLWGQDLTVLLVLLRGGLDLWVQQSLNAQLPARLTRRLQWAAGAHLWSGGRQNKQRSDQTGVWSPVNGRLMTARGALPHGFVVPTLWSQGADGLLRRWWKSRYKLDWLFKTCIVSMNAVIRNWIINHYTQLSCHR